MEQAVRKSYSWYMVKLEIPDPLKQEFETVERLWCSSAETRGVDALILAWVKYEKQLRRLFCFLIFQHPKMTRGLEIDKVIDVLAANRDLNPETFIDGIKALGVPSIPELLSARYEGLSKEISRIKKYRNKLVHGQLTGEKIGARKLECDVLWIIDWVTCLAAAAEKQFGYDGLRRNTYDSAKSAAHIAVAKYPFSDPVEFKEWLSRSVTPKKSKKTGS